VDPTDLRQLLHGVQQLLVRILVVPNDPQELRPFGVGRPALDVELDARRIGPAVQIDGETGEALRHVLS
jgi:hypothetical protein